MSAVVDSAFQVIAEPAAALQASVTGLFWQLMMLSVFPCFYSCPPPFYGKKTPMGLKRHLMFWLRVHASCILCKADSNSMQAFVASRSGPWLLPSMQKTKQMCVWHMHAHNQQKRGSNFMCSICFLGCFEMQRLLLQQSPYGLFFLLAFLPMCTWEHNVGQTFATDDACCQTSQGSSVQDLSCTYLAHHELESVFIIIIIIIFCPSISCTCKMVG